MFILCGRSFAIYASSLTVPNADDLICCIDLLKVSSEFNEFYFKKNREKNG